MSTELLHLTGGAMCAGRGQVVSVATCADERYVPGLLVTLGSILLFSDPAVRIDAVVLDCGIVDESWRRVASELGKFAGRLHLQRVQVENLLPTGLPPGPQGCLAAYARLLLPEISNSTTVVYVDSDVMFFKDVVELWRTDLCGYVAAACQDEMIPSIAQDCVPSENVPGEAPYFNSGVMLIDLESWRRDDIGRKAIDFLRRHGRQCRFHDQTALNTILAGRVRLLDGCWNRTSSLRPDQFIGEPFNVHLVFAHKPWLRASANFFAQLWYSMYYATTGRHWHRFAATAIPRKFKYLLNSAVYNGALLSSCYGGLLSLPLGACLGRRRVAHLREHFRQHRGYMKRVRGFASTVDARQPGRATFKPITGRTG